MKDKSKFILGIIAIFAICAVTLLFYTWFHWPLWMEQRDWPKSLPLSGGKYFQQQFTIPVGHYSQSDPRWAAENLAETPYTLAAEGCAVAAAAMALSHKGSTLNPSELNSALVDFPNGFTPQGWIYWEAAAAVASPRKVAAVYEGPPSFERMDRELVSGIPVIVRLRMPSGMMHFVLAVGKNGQDYLVLDPADPAGSPPRPLSTVGGEITGMRFYLEKMPLFNRHFMVPVPQISAQ